jgi:hypothetical protein
VSRVPSRPGVPPPDQPAAAEEYARRLAQRGVPVAAMLRAYRIGSARFEDWCLQELGRRSDDATAISAAGPCSRASR